jgi:hypothetical protein
MRDIPLSARDRRLRTAKLWIVPVGILLATFGTACSTNSAGSSSSPHRNATTAETLLSACLLDNGATSAGEAGPGKWQADFPHGLTITYHLTRAGKVTDAKHVPATGVVGRLWRSCGRRLIHMNSSGLPFATAPS